MSNTAKKGRPVDFIKCSILFDETKKQWVRIATQRLMCALNFNAFPSRTSLFWHNNLSGDQTPNCFCEKWNKLWYLEELSDTVGFSLELGACYPFRGDWLREILATNSLLALSTATRWWTCLTNLVWNDKYMLWEWSENTFFFKQSRGEDNCLQEVFSNGSTFCERQPPGGGLGLHISRLCRQKLQERKKINCWPYIDIIVDYICCHAV